MFSLEQRSVIFGDGLSSSYHTVSTPLIFTVNTLITSLLAAEAITGFIICTGRTVL